MSVIEKVTLQELGPKPWGTETLFAHADSYIGKVLRMKAGYGGPLQYHERKDETFMLLDGEALVTYRDELGNFTSVKMHAGEAYHVPPGAVHQVQAITECLFVEASNPVFDDRVAVHR
jgi:mannose-6-phosphate isomerase-like protein (cupin superfamily)